MNGQVVGSAEAQSHTRYEAIARARARVCLCVRVRTASQPARSSSAESESLRPLTRQDTIRERGVHLELRSVMARKRAERPWPACRGMRSLSRGVRAMHHHHAHEAATAMRLPAAAAASCACIIDPGVGGPWHCGAGMPGWTGGRDGEDEEGRQARACGGGRQKISWVRGPCHGCGRKMRASDGRRRRRRRRHKPRPLSNERGVIGRRSLPERPGRKRIHRHAGRSGKAWLWARTHARPQNGHDARTHPPLCPCLDGHCTAGLRFQSRLDDMRGTSSLQRRAKECGV